MNLIRGQLAVRKESVGSATICILVLAPWLAVSQPFTDTVIQLENQKPGTSSWLLTNPSPAGGIEGYASLTSVPRGGQIALFVNTTNANYWLDVYRIGWYGGIGARQVFGPISIPGTSQPMPAIEPVTGLVECNWTNPYTLHIPKLAFVNGQPPDWVSGVYLAKLTGNEDGFQSYIIFTVRDDEGGSELLMQLSFTTYQAYNGWGGASLYGPIYGSSNRRATKVSFNRPFSCWNPYWKGSGEFVMGISGDGAGWECNLVRWLEREGYDVSYCTSLDVHENAPLLWNHKAFISAGHDEYWSYPMRWNVQASRDRGINLAFLSANTCYWQVRFEPSADGGSNRTMVCYKSLADPLYNTPLSNFTTVTFRHPAIGDPESSLLGVSYIAGGLDLDLVVNDPSHWLFANTGLRAGDFLSGMLGYEVDAINDSSPTNIQVACASPFVWSPKAGPLLTNSHAASYQAASGAKVFAGGSMQWSWGLDDFNTPLSKQNAALQQMTRNLMAQMRNTNPPSATMFIRADSASRGNWTLGYGIEGFAFPGDATNLPAYAALAPLNGTVQHFSSAPANPNNLQRATGAGRQLSGWSSATNLTFDLNLSDNQNHQVALYFYDWDNSGRAQMVDVLDAGTTNLLDRRIINGFTNGQWWVWQVHGQVRFQITSLAGPDCLLNALVLGTGSSVQFISEDSTSQGNWLPAYGLDGAIIAGDTAPQPPAYLTLGVTAALTNWSLASSDPRAPAPSGDSQGPFAAWTTTAPDTRSSVFLNFTDTDWHQLAVYCVDAERLGRAEVISLVDLASHAVLDSRTISDFREGKYLVWNLRGRLQLNLQTLGAAPGVISAVFFGPPNLPPQVTITSPTNQQVVALPSQILLQADAWDSDGAIAQVSFFSNGVLLGTITNSPYVFAWSNAIVGSYTLTAQALDDRMATAISGPVVISVVPGPNYNPPSIQIVSPADGQSGLSPTNISLQATVAGTSAPPVALQFLLDGSPFGPLLTNEPFVLTGQSVTEGIHTISASAVDSFGLIAQSPTNSFTVSWAHAKVIFRRLDAITEGDWRGPYGGEGNILASSGSRAPAYARVKTVGNSSIVWRSTTSDRRALQKPNGGDRFAAAWYSTTNFSLDCQLLDAQPHRVALYFLDWDGDGGAESVQVFDQDTGQLLDSETVSGFTNGVYLVWDVVGHVTFTFSSSTSNELPSLSGVFFDNPSDLPRVNLTAPRDGSRYLPGTTTFLHATAYAGSSSLDHVDFLANGLVLGTVSAGPAYSFAWTNLPRGHYNVAARAVDSQGRATLSSTLSLQIEAARASAAFASSDAHSQGNWVGQRGREGYVLAGDASSIPSFATVNTNGQFISWNRSTSDARALQRATGPSRVAASWYAFTNLLIDVELTDGLYHRVGMYFLDWPNLHIGESVDLLDSLSGQVLAHRDVPAFGGGDFEQWDVQGHVTFRVSRGGGLPALVSAIFLDPSPILSPISITSPLQDAILVAPASITITADGQPDPRITRVDFFQNGRLLGSVTNSPPWNFFWTNVPFGRLTLFARAISDVSASNSPTVSITTIPIDGLAFGPPFVLPGGFLSLSGVAPSGLQVWLLSSTNILDDLSWTELTSATSVSNQFNFLLPDPGTYPQRFYRAVIRP